MGKKLLALKDGSSKSASLEIYFEHFVEGASAAGNYVYSLNLKERRADLAEKLAAADTILIAAELFNLESFVENTLGALTNKAEIYYIAVPDRRMTEKDTKTLYDKMNEKYFSAAKGVLYGIEDEEIDTEILSFAEVDLPSEAHEMGERI